MFDLTTRLGVPEMSQVLFAFLFGCNQPNGNLVLLEKDKYLHFLCLPLKYHLADLQNRPNGNSVAQVKIVKRYLFPKWTEL